MFPGTMADHETQGLADREADEDDDQSDERGLDARFLDEEGGDLWSDRDAQEQPEEASAILEKRRRRRARPRSRRRCSIHMPRPVINALTVRPQMRKDAAPNGIHGTDSKRVLPRRCASISSAAGNNPPYA